MTWLALIGTILKQGMDHWQERNQAKHEARLEEIKNRAKWEAEMAGSTQTSWKDEYVLLLVSFPIWGIVYGAILNDPDVNYRVGLALNQLDTLPDWYKFLVVTIFLASFGIRMAGPLTSMLKRK